MARGGDQALTRTAFAAVCALLLLLLWPVFYGGVQTIHDMGEWYVPMRHYYQQCLLNGDAFDWNPHVYGGYYLQGDGQVGMYHPLHWLLYRFLPLVVAVNLEMTIGFFAMLVGVFVLLRRWRVPRHAALFGGMVVAFSGYPFRHFEHMNAIQLLGHVPWMLVLVDIAVRSKSPRAAAFAALGVSALTVSELLIGYPQYFWFSSFCEAAYVLALLPSRLRSGQPFFGRLAWLALCKGVGVVGGAVQLMPTADLLTTSVREHMSREDRSQWPWHPLEISTLVAPYVFQPKTLASFHPGVVSIALIAWMLVRRGLTRLRRGYVVGLLAVITLTVWLALGQAGLLYELHLDLPVIGVFRMPYRYLSITAIAVGLLAALAFTDLVRTSRAPTQGRPFLFVLPVLGLLAIGAVYALDSLDRVFYLERHVGAYPMAFVGVASLALAAWLVHRSERGSRAALVGLVVLAAVDLGAYGGQWVYRRGAPVTLEEYTRAIPKPPEHEGRVIAAVANQYLFFDISIPGGYMPLVPDAPFLQEIDEFGERSVPHLRVAGIEWVQHGEGGNLWTQQSWCIEALRNQNTVFARVDDPMPRARLVTEVAVSDDPVAATGEVDVARVAVVEAPVELDAGDPGNARASWDRPGLIRVQVEPTGRQLLVVNERMRPGWVARTQDRELPLVRTYGTFLGCVVEPGVHQVEFAFEPESLRHGRMITLGALGALLLLTLGTWVVMGRRGAPKPA